MAGNLGLYPMLPALRQELTLYKAPAAKDGSPSWSLLDPVRNLYFRIDWLTFEILSRWELSDPQILLTAISDETPIQAEEEDIDSVVRFVTANELVCQPTAEGTVWLHKLHEKRKPGVWRWLLHHYLFFRIPLWHPDSWIKATLPKVNPFFTQTFLMLSVFVLMLSLIEISRQWDGFVLTLIDTISWQGFFGYILALILVKFFHELGHAFTAKRFGCHVPVMGVAFLVMFPMAYTDVNDVWKLTSRSQRIAVGAAGILTELTIAVWALGLWCLLPDSLLRDMVFLLSTTTWISTIIVNASPFLRFDGYFLIMDWLDMPNLHQRTFELTKWRLREWLFALRTPIPEYLSRRRLNALLLFGFSIWIYRLVVFFGIAILVYVMIPKPLGPILAAIELVWFIGLPIWKEVMHWRTLFPQALFTGRSWLSFLVMFLIFIAIFIPWDRRIHTVGLLKPAKTFSVVTPAASQIKKIHINEYGEVKIDQFLLELNAPDIHFQRQVLEKRKNLLQWQIKSAGVDIMLRQQQQIAFASLNKINAELQGVDDKLSSFTPIAPVSGHFFFEDINLNRGDWLQENETIGVIVDSSEWEIIAYLNESQLGRITLGDKGMFYPDTPEAASLSIQIVDINYDATKILPEQILSSTAGGLIIVHETDEGTVPEQALYRVRLSILDEYKPNKVRILRGKAILFGRPKAYIDDFTRAAAALFYREAGF